MNPSKRSDTRTGILIGAGVLVTVVAALGIGVVAVAANGDEVVQYPPGQRPCTEVINATGYVTDAMLARGISVEDPTGAISNALGDAREVLNDRAGRSTEYDAAEYNRVADELSARAEDLIAAYGLEDPATPYEEHPGLSADAETAYADAERALQRVCGW